MGDAVVVQGLGLLGLYAAALCKARGARLVIGVDKVAARRDLAALRRRSCFSAMTVEARSRSLCKPEGADVVIELCGYPEVIPAGIQTCAPAGATCWADW